MPRTSNVFLNDSVPLITASTPHLIAYFKTRKDTIKASAGNSVEYLFKDTIIVPKQYLKQSYTIKLEVDNSKTTVPDSNIFFPANNNFHTSKDSSKDQIFLYTIKLKRGTNHERTLSLLLNVYDSSNQRVSLCDSCKGKQIYIERYKNYDSTNVNHELWMFIGTNIDLVDGIQAQDLYFRADYLTLIAKRQWMLISFGKSRYFDYSDSLQNQEYYFFKYPVINDSLGYFQEHYNGLHVSQTDNIFLTLRYLQELSHPSKYIRMFLVVGLELQYITTTRTWKDLYFLDTTVTKVPYNNGRLPFFTTSISRIVEKSWNYGLAGGFMHIYNQDDLNFKTLLMFGVYYSQYPNVLSSQATGMTINDYKHLTSYYARFRIDATVLDPGISLGFEAVVNYQRPTDTNVFNVGDTKLVRPFFNISLTKVLDVKHLKSLFTGVTPASMD